MNQKNRINSPAKGDEKEALKHFYGAIKKNSGKDSFKQQAQNRIHNIKGNMKQ